MADALTHLDDRPGDAGSEQTLLTRLQSGDASALDQLLKLHWASLVRYAGRLLRDHDGAQDLVQDTFVRLWERREQLLVGSLRAYCFRVLHNLVLDEIRRRRLRALWKLKLDSEPAQASELDLLREERELAVSRAIDALPPRRRQTLILAHLHGLSYQEIAIVMDVSPATVKNQVAAALAQLRRTVRVRE